MAAPQHASRRPAPIAGSAAACWRGGAPTATVSVRGDPDHPANFGRLCSKGSALAETIGLDDRLLFPEVHGAASDWDDALDLVAAQVHRDDPRARPRLGRLLRLGPAADRGLLRRQQADEGLHRLGQHRHQLAPVHGLVGRRPQARLRLRHGARLLRGSRARRSRRARRLQSRLVPSGALPAHRGRQGEAAGDEGRADRSAPHGDRRHRRSASADQARRRRRAVPRAAALSGAQPRDQAHATSSAHTTGFKEALRAAETLDLYDIVAA